MRQWGEAGGGCRRKTRKIPANSDRNDITQNRIVSLSRFISLKLCGIIRLCIFLLLLVLVCLSLLSLLLLLAFIIIFLSLGLLPFRFVVFFSCMSLPAVQLFRCQWFFFSSSCHTIGNFALWNYNKEIAGIERSSYPPQFFPLFPIFIVELVLGQIIGKNERIKKNRFYGDFVDTRTIPRLHEYFALAIIFGYTLNGKWWFS